MRLTIKLVRKMYPERCIKETGKKHNPYEVDGVLSNAKSLTELEQELCGTSSGTASNS